jgi:hypothetical protein
VSGLGALVMSGIPPTGLGYYVRDRVDDAPGSFVCVPVGRTDAPALAEAAHARGLQVWATKYVGNWGPTSWAHSLDECERFADAHGCVGVVPDVEDEWPDLDRAHRVAGYHEMGAAFAAASRRRRVMVTGYPSLPDLTELAAACGSSCTGNVQIYARTNQDPAAWASWYARWASAWGAERTTIAIAAWPASSLLTTPEGYARYLAGLPRAAGAIAWRGTGPMPDYMRQQLAAWSPGGSPLATAALAVEGVVTRPQVIVALLLLAILVVAFVVKVRTA